MEIFYSFYKIFFTALLIFYLYKMMFKGILKNEGKIYKVLRITIFLLIAVNFISDTVDDIKKKDNTSYIEHFQEPMRNSYDIVEKDGKLYAIIDRSSSMIHKMIVAEVDEVTEKENEGENITIDFSDIKMFDGEEEYSHIKDFEKVVFKNKIFQKVKDKDLVYLDGFTYKIVDKNENNITVKFDGRKKTKYEDLVPYVNNKFIPQNYLDIYNTGDTNTQEKTLTILFD